MQNVYRQLCSRRALIAGLTSTYLSAHKVYSKRQTPPFDLGFGLEVRDFRLFPTADVMRFLVEVHNTSDTPIDAPTVGVILPHQSDDVNYGWATPISPVLHPHKSGGFIGVSPVGLVRDSDWGEPKWILCNKPGTVMSEALAPWHVDISTELILRDTEHLEIVTTITNKSDQATSNLKINALLWDTTGRICGSTYDLAVPRIQLGDSITASVHVAPKRFIDNIANPFALISSVEGLRATPTLQPMTPLLFGRCEILMPWNQ